MSCSPKFCSPLLRGLGFLALAAVVLQPGPASAAEVKKPDCAALEAWAASVDGKDRWQPIEGYRGWVPRAFQEPAFEALFGAPVLEWRSEDAVEIAAHVFECGGQADKAKRREARQVLYAVRGYFQGNLRGLLGRQEKMAARAERDAERQAKREARDAERRREQAAQAQARSEAQQNERDAQIEEALAALLEEPASHELLRTLAMLRAVDINNREQFDRAQRRVGPAARNLMFRLSQQGSDLRDPRVAPRIEERYVALRAEIVADYRARTAALNTSTQSLRFLDRWQQEVGRQLPALLGQETSKALLEEMAAKRSSIQAGIFARAKELIDAAEKNSDGDAAELALIDKIVVNSAKAGLSREQLAEVQSYAAARQQVLAERQLAAARAELASYPETLQGLDKLRRDLLSARRGPLKRAGEEAFNGYLQAGRARLTEIAEEALPEFERGLAELPESQDGLKMLEATLVSEEGFDQVGEEVRADYLAALEERRSAIAETLAAQAAARRTAALEAGGDPDLVGFRYVDREHASLLEFRDEKLVILNFLGLRSAGDYQVSAEDVIVRGPNGTLVLARTGSGETTKLSGMGLVFQRAPD